MTSNPLEDDTESSWRWQMILLEMTQDAFRDEKGFSWRWHGFLLEITHDPLRNDTGCSWRWHRILLEMTKEYLEMTQDPRKDDIGSSWIIQDLVSSKRGFCVIFERILYQGRIQGWAMERTVTPGKLLIPEGEALGISFGK